jgi:hypothetical protein
MWEMDCQESTMIWNLRKLKVGVLALSLACVAGLAGNVFAQGASEASDAKARAAVRQMGDFLAKQKSFTLKAASSIEVVLKNGQKLQFDQAAEVAVARPDKLRAARVGDELRQEMFYDGKAITIFSQVGGVPYFATASAPPTIEGALDFARESLDVIAPAGDLLYANAADILMEDVVSAMVVGQSTIGGVRCKHLAFQGDQVDWQIWIEDGPRPLPRKMVITSKLQAGQPQFIVMTSDWNLAPKLAAERFRFAPPKGATKIDFLPPAGKKGGEGKQ